MKNRGALQLRFKTCMNWTRVDKTMRLLRRVFQLKHLLTANRMRRLLKFRLNLVTSTRDHKLKEACLCMTTILSVSIKLTITSKVILWVVKERWNACRNLKNQFNIEKDMIWEINSFLMIIAVQRVSINSEKRERIKYRNRKVGVDQNTLKRTILRKITLQAVR